MKKIFTLIVFAALITIKANAQDGISGLFKGSSDDVNKLLGAYTNPLFKGFGNSLNGGWTNTAKTQKFLRFAVRVSASVSIIPDADKTYDFTQIGLSSNFKPANASQTIAPTFGGDKDATAPSITYTDANTGGKYTTALPKGVIEYIPAPQIQLTVGLIKNTDVTLRIIPQFQITSDVGSVGMFGIGFKHNIAQDFGTASHIIPFDLAVAVGYTRLNYSKPMDVKPDSPNGGVSPANADFTNQTLQGNFSGWNTQVILSKKLLFFTPFVSVGYLTSTTDVGLKGNFPFVTGVDATNKPKYTAINNPISIGGTSASQVSGLREDIGFQLSLTFLKIYASCSNAEYKSVNAGIGLGF